MVVTKVKVYKLKNYYNIALNVKSLLTLANFPQDEKYKLKSQRDTTNSY